MTRGTSGLPDLHISYNPTMKKNRGQLVTQHLEKVSRKVLEKYQDTLRTNLKGRHGIYALYRGNKLYYVGLASSLRSRLQNHLKDQHSKRWDRFSVYLTLKNQHIHELESLVLRIASPQGNIQKGHFYHSQNLERLLRSKLKKQMLAELHSVFHSKAEPVEEDAHSPKSRPGALYDFIEKPIRLRFRYKNRVYKAHVLKNGFVSYGGKRYVDHPARHMLSRSAALMVGSHGNLSAPRAIGSQSTNFENSACPSITEN